MRLLALVPAAAMALGVLLFGAWGAVGAAAGALAALVAWQAGAGRRAALLAAVLPPLVATGPSIVAPLALLGLTAVWQRTGRVEVFALAALGALWPAPGGALVAALGGAALLALGSGTRALLGLPVAGASWLALRQGAPLLAAAFIAVGLVARGIAAHPANLTMARRIAGLGLLAAPAPAIAALVVQASGAGLDLAASLATAGEAVLLGIALLLAHLGAAVLLRAGDRQRALGLVSAWALPAAAVGAWATPGSESVFGALPGVAAAAVVVGLAAAWLLALTGSTPVLRRAPFTGQRPPKENFIHE
ncbi:MAG: hypothetical protein LC624_02630 [Halobacteriales archaeon]|nr:hypothetical protein [Halobacteriales archaeon]